MTATAAWTVEDSARLYRIDGWGDPYFSIGPNGDVVVTPRGDGGPAIDLRQLVEDLQVRGLTLPLLIRFSDILGDRIRRINESFAEAIGEYEYGGEYRGVYPIKVNQQRHIVEELLQHGRPYHLGRSEERRGGKEW